jgi:electron transport complex protein RnfA
MLDVLLLLISAVLVNNLVLAQFLGLCPFVGVTQRTDDALSMGLATAFVMTLGAAVSYLLQHYVLVPFGLEALRLIVFIFVIATLVAIVEIVIRQFSPVLHQVLGIYLPLITTNCAVLGVVLISLRDELGFVDTLLYATGAAAGFTLVMAIFAGLRERLAPNRIPAPFRGAPIVLVTAGILSLAFMGFAGIGS